MCKHCNKNFFFIYQTALKAFLYKICFAIYFMLWCIGIVCCIGLKKFFLHLELFLEILAIQSVQNILGSIHIHIFSKLK